MTDAARELPMTETQYLEFEKNAEVRHEFEDGALWAMSGDKRVNNRIALNIAKTLDDVSIERGCRTYMADTKVVTQKGNFFYPDVLVSCAPPPQDPLTESNPCVIFEVLSPSTEARDRGVKLQAYTFDIPALEQYLLVSSEERLVEVYQRASGGIWAYQVYRNDDDTVPIRCLETSLTLEQMYRYVDRETPQT
jgi:Uma2 family endonuclease